MKTTFEFDGKGYLTLTAEGQSVTLSKENPKAELSLSDGAEIEAVHSEKEPKEKEKMTLGKILLLIVFIPIILIIFLIAFAVALFGGMDGIAPEKFFKENNPFKTRKKFILEKAGETVKISAENPVFEKKNLEYIILPQIAADGAITFEESEYSYEQKHTRLNYKTDAYPQCIIIGIASASLAALGIFSMFHLPPIAENPVFFILCLLASLALTAFLALAVWAIVRTEKTLKKTENNILKITKGKTEK
jgi:hypothetical protein